MKYLVKRGIEKDGAWRYEAGEIVTGHQIRGAPVTAWLESGVLEVVEDDPEDAED